MEPDEADALIREVAVRFGQGRTDIDEMWSVFHTNLYDLCGDHPMTDDMSSLFDALERWEVAITSEKAAAVAEARTAARHLNDKT